MQTWLTSAARTRCRSPFQVNNVSLIIVGVWMWTGFAVVVLSAGLKGISTEMLEAARVDGANEWQIFRRIILPILSPTIVVIATTLVIQSLKLFDLVWVMTGGRFKTDVVATLFFKEAFVVRDFGVGAALAVVLLLWVVPDHGDHDPAIPVPGGDTLMAVLHDAARCRPVRAARARCTSRASSPDGSPLHLRSLVADGRHLEHPDGRPAGQLVPRPTRDRVSGWWHALIHPDQWTLRQLPRGAEQAGHGPRVRQQHPHRRARRPSSSSSSRRPRPTRSPGCSFPLRNTLFLLVVAHARRARCR